MTVFRHEHQKMSRKSGLEGRKSSVNCPKQHLQKFVFSHAVNCRVAFSSDQMFAATKVNDVGEDVGCGATPRTGTRRRKHN